ncbi:MAG TPA: extracellular solute-binding protein [Clostridiales bacterium]|nr:extracellular solute-binding protein [Clostridiales bacterium]
MKKTLALILVLGMLAGVLFGCSRPADQPSGSDATPKPTEPANNSGSEGTDDEEKIENFNATGYPIVNDKITLSIFSVKAAIQGDWEQMPFWQEMEKMTNISFTFDLATPETALERKSLLLGSGDYPDIFYGAGLSGDEELTYGSQGVFVELTNLVDKYAPNIKAFFAENPNYKNMSLASDGNWYTLPSISLAPRDTVATKLWVNEEWLKNLGMAMPKTIDEYYAVLKAFKEKDPNGNGSADEIPMSFSRDQLGMTRGAFLAAYGVMYNSEQFDVKDGKVFFIPTSDAWKAYLTFMNKLYKEGLMDPESFTQTAQQYVAKGNQTLIGSFANLASYIVDTMDNYPKYKAIPPLTSELNDKQIWPSKYPINFGQFAITDKNKYPEASIRWVDYFFTQEGGAFMNQGPEGLGWQYIDAERKMWEKIIPEGYGSSEEYRGTLTPNCGTATPGVVSAEFLLGLNAAHVVNLEEQIAEAYLPYMKDSFPIVKLTAAEQEEAATLKTDILKYVEQMEASFITGETDLSGWDDYVANLEKMKVSRLVEIYQAAYDRFAGAN